MTRVFNVIIERDAEGYHIASVPELRGCHTQARSLDTLMRRIREAIESYLGVESEERHLRNSSGSSVSGSKYEKTATAQRSRADWWVAQGRL